MDSLAGPAGICYHKIGMNAGNAELLIGKTRPPMLPPDWIARPRPAGRLTDALRHRIVLLSAPAGYGKTTLAVETLTRTAASLAWVSLDEGDNNADSFLAYLVAALQAVMPDVCGPMLGAIGSPNPPPAERVITSLVNSLNRHEGEVMIVLDDYHVVESRTVHDAFIFLAEHLPPNAHCVLISRMDPPLPLSRWRGKGYMTEIRMDDLSFSLEEASAFFGSLPGVFLSEKDIQTLETRTEGWIAGLKMAAFSLKGKNDVSGYIESFSGSNRYVLDYLAEEVLGRQEPDLRRFLLETSILDRLYGPLCDAVTGMNDCRSLLSRLESANLFITALDDERRWYRYHQLFTSILRNRLEQSGAGLAEALHRRAGEWFEKEGRFGEAIRHFLLAGDNERAVALLENAAPIMLGRDQAAYLLYFIPRIPEPEILASPWLCVCFAWAALVANKPDVLSIMLSRCMKAVAGGPDALPPESRGQWRRIKGHTLSIRSFAAQAQNDVSLAVSLAEEANRELPQDDIDDLLARAVNSLSLAGFHQQSGDIAKAVPYLEELLAAGRRIDYHYAVLAALGGLAEIQMRLSRFQRAEELCGEAVESGSRWGNPYPPPQTALAYAVLGRLMYERNDLSGASQNLTTAIKMGEAGFNADAVLKACLSMARVSQILGHTAAADEYIRRAENLGPWVSPPPEVRQIPAFKARLALFRGDTAAASEWGARRPGSLPLSEVPEYCLEFDCLTLVRLHLAEGGFEGLPKYLDGFIRNARMQERTDAMLEGLILKALAQERLGDLAGAEDTILHALDFGEGAGYVRLFVDEGKPKARLLGRAALADHVHAEYASFLLGIIARERGQEKDEAKGFRGTGTLPEPLSPREVEVLTYIAQGKSNRETGDALFVAVGTIKKHLNTIFGKLGVKNRTQAVARARGLGIL